MRLSVRQRRGIWVGIALMLIQLLAPALSHGLARAMQVRASAVWTDSWCHSPVSGPSAGTPDPQEVIDLYVDPADLPATPQEQLQLRACAYCDLLPCCLAALPIPAASGEVPREEACSGGVPDWTHLPLPHTERPAPIHPVRGPPAAPRQR